MAIDVVVTGQSIGKMLTETLDLPKFTRSFVLRCEVDHVVTVECEYYPAIDTGALEVALAEFFLVRRDRPKVPAADFDAWMRERNEKAHADLNRRLAQLSRMDAQKA